MPKNENEYSTVVQVFIEPQDYHRFQDAMYQNGIAFYCAGEWGTFATLEEIEAELEGK